MSAADKDNQWSDVAPRLARLTHSGFGVHHAVRLDANDLAGRERLAHYMLRCPFGLERLIRVTHWDISPDGVVVGGQHPTVRSRIYDVSALVINWAHGLALIDLVAEDAWVNSAAFEVSDHLVVVATLKVHIKLEHLLFNLQKASEAEPPFVRPHQVLGNARSFDLESEYYLGLLDRFRIARSVSIQSLRSVGPTLGDGVTEDELDACGRAAFGLLDTLR